MWTMYGLYMQVLQQSFATCQLLMEIAITKLKEKKLCGTFSWTATNVDAGLIVMFAMCATRCGHGTTLGKYAHAARESAFNNRLCIKSEE